MFWVVVVVFGCCVTVFGSVGTFSLASILFPGGFYCSFCFRLFSRLVIYIFVWFCPRFEFYLFIVLFYSLFSFCLCLVCGLFGLFCLLFVVTLFRLSNGFTLLVH